MNPSALPTHMKQECTFAHFSNLACNHLTLFCFPVYFSHSFGRGGYANITADELPYTEGPVNPHGATHPHATHNHLVQIFGRGGTGNITSKA
jgi:hypothetical protein